MCTQTTNKIMGVSKNTIKKDHFEDRIKQVVRRNNGFTAPPSTEVRKSRKCVVQ